MGKPLHWRGRLAALVVEAGRRQFVYGEHDCLTFVADAIRLQGGPDIAAPYRGRYTSYREGIRLLRADGHKDHLALVRAALPEIAPAFAKVGDIAAVVQPGLPPALGIVGGAHIILPIHEGRGTTNLPMTEASLAFEVR